MAIAVAIFAALELALMRAQTPEQFNAIVRWLHVPLWIMIASLVVFVRLYLRAGRWWLAWTVIGVRTLSLILNFTFSPNINYREITALKQIRFLGESVSVAEGVVNPWMVVAQFGLVLLVVFVIDATITASRRGERRQALMVGGSTLLFVMLGIAESVLIPWGLVAMPPTVSLFYQCLVAAMAYELSYDVIHAAALAGHLRVSEAGLRESEERFRLTVEASPSGVVLVDTKGKIVLVNTQTERMFGYSRAEMIGQPLEILVPERFRALHPGHRAKFLAAPEARAMGAGRELFGLRKDDTEFPIEIGLNPIKTLDGILVLSSIVDITARKRAELEELRHREELSHLSRVTSMGELAASIAHELNQPLSGITINASTGQLYIDRGDVDLGEVHHLLDDILADGRRAGEVIRGIQNMVKKGSSTRQRVNLNEVVTDAVRMVNPNAILQSCQLQTLLEPNLPAVEANPVQLQQVLLNLIMNAFDAVQNAEVGCRKVLIATQYTHSGTIRTSVRDYGPGMPEDVRERVFEQFFTTKSKGLGMGLAIVRSIITSHGGSIAAENAEGGGALFHFTLPTTACSS